MHEEKHFEEEDEEVVSNKIANIHNDIKAVKAELKASHLTGSKKTRAKALVRQLEQGYNELSQQTTKAGRREVARSMKVAASELKEFMQPEVHQPSLEEKKEKIMSLVRSAEEEYASKDLSSSVKSQIHRQFESMKTELESEDSAHELKMNLKEKLQAIKDLEAKDLEEKNQGDDNDFEEESAADEE